MANTLFYQLSHTDRFTRNKKITFSAQSYASNIVTATRDTHCEANVA